MHEDRNRKKANDDPYLSSDGKVMANKLGLTDPDQLSEVEFMYAIQNRPIALNRAKAKINKGHPIDLDLWQGIHKDLFGDVYTWAGQTRSVNISKEHTLFLDNSRLQNGASYAFGELEKKNFLKGLPPQEFHKEMAHAFTELNFVHPFREGNGRSQRALFSVIATEAGYNLDWEKVDKKEFIHAVIQSENGKSEPLSDVFKNITTPIKTKQIKKQQNKEIEREM